MLGDYAGAIADFDKLLEYKFCQSSYYDYVWIYRGFARYELGDYAGAIADLEKGISLDGDWANQSEPFRYLGKCYDSLGQREKARINYDRAGR
jgi:tetratricopeptide (TPR) repeat protein